MPMEENELLEVSLGSTSSRGVLMLSEVHQLLFLTATATSHNMHLLCMYFKVDHTFVSCGNVVGLGVIVSTSVIHKFAVTIMFVYC